MRRMLDPKELGGGGGGGKLYCHCIKVTEGYNAAIVLNFFNYSDIPFTIDSFKEKFGTKELPCSGIVKSFKGSTINAIPYYLTTSKGSLACKAMRMDSGFVFLDISTFEFKDDVIPA